MSEAYDDKPQWDLVSFDDASIEINEAGEKILKITGETPHSSSNGCEVQLFPVKYTTKPGYAQVDVMWNRTNALFTSPCPYDISVPVASITGSKGIELRGASGTTRLDV